MRFHRTEKRLKNCYILTNTDLSAHCLKLPIDEVGVSSFKSTSISSNQIRTAFFIMYVDMNHNKSKVLKNRYSMKY